MLQVKAQLIERQTQGASQELRWLAPDLARQLTPGQPVLLHAGWGLDPYLRRAFYPIAFDAETWTLRLPPSGDWGHAWLRAAPLGVQTDCLGPIGIGYNLPGALSGASHTLLCVGEGESSWSLLPAVLRAADYGYAVTLAVEAVSGRDLIPNRRLPASVEYHLATVDGTITAAPLRGAGVAPGRGRLAPPKLAPQLPELLAWADMVLAAGSLAFYQMLAPAIQQARFDLKRGFAQVLYPAPILCGTGACQACSSDVAGGRHRVCLRGPVFDLVDVLP